GPLGAHVVAVEADRLEDLDHLGVQVLLVERELLPRAGGQGVEDAAVAVAVAPCGLHAAPRIGAQTGKAATAARASTSAHCPTRLRRASSCGRAPGSPKRPRSTRPRLTAPPGSRLRLSSAGSASSARSLTARRTIQGIAAAAAAST